MPKYSQIKGKDLIKILKKHGFEEHSWSGSHCTMKNIGTQKRVTIPVHANKTIGKGLLKAILNQVGLDKTIFD